jgi:hypothetical protein
VNLVVTNVPGPQFELTMGQNSLLDIFPLVPLGNNMNLGVAIVSYNGTIDIGLVGDWDALSDLDQLGEFFTEAMAELAEVAGVDMRANTPSRDEETVRTNGRAPERRFDRDRPYEPAPEYQDSPAETVVMERPVFPEPPVEVEEELVEQVAERGAETTPGAEIDIDEPWEGYDRMKVAEIRERLMNEATPATAGMVEIYERANKARKQVIDASEKAQRGQV